MLLRRCRSSRMQFVNLPRVHPRPHHPRGRSQSPTADHPLVPFVSFVVPTQTTRRGRLVRPRPGFPTMHQLARFPLVPRVPWLPQVCLSLVQKQPKTVRESSAGAPVATWEPRFRAFRVFRGSHPNHESGTPHPPAARSSDRASVGSVSVSSECSVVTAGPSVAGTEAAEDSS